MNVPATTQDLFTEIRELILNARQHVATQVNTELLATYWQIGRMIVEHEQNHQERADYGKQVLKQLSKALTHEFGRGFSRSNLQNMRAFYLTYQKCQTLSGNSLSKKVVNWRPFSRHITPHAVKCMWGDSYVS